MNILNLIGMGGVDKKEHNAALKREGFFQYGTTSLIFILLFQQYSELHNEFNKWDLILNWIVWAILLIEVIILIISVQNKLKFIGNNWFIILISIISFPPFFGPAILTLRFMRGLILFRVLKPSLITLKTVLETNNLGKILLVSVLVTITAGISVTFFDPSFKNVDNGIWWSWETITTVGYGDEAPRTIISRIIAIILMILGTTIFSILTANLSAHFVRKDMGEQQKKELELLERIKLIEKKISELSKD